MARKTTQIFKVTPEKGRPVKSVAVRFTDSHFCLDITYADGEHDTRWRGYDITKELSL